MTVHDLPPSSPWYVQLAVRVGLPTTLAIVLLWFILLQQTDVFKQLATNDARIVANQQLILESLAMTARILAQHGVVTSRINAYVLCTNMAATERERRECLAALTAQEK